MEELVQIGRSVARVDAMEKVTGRASFCLDVALPGMLVARVLRCDLAHARIVKVDTSRAERLPGVKAVVTGKDMIAPISGVIEDQYILAKDEVRFPGEGVAAVAAVEEDVAEEALNLIRVDYEELPAVFDPEEAMRPGGPMVHSRMMEYSCKPGFNPIAGTNICTYFKLRKGDVEAGFKASRVVSQDRFTTPMIQHCPLEPHVAVAQWDGSGRLAIWSSIQSPYSMRAQLASAFKLPLDKVRVIAPYVGGGFGAKGSMKNSDGAAAALAAKTNGRPVKITLSRSEDLGTSVVRQPTVVEMKTGISAEGKILARQIKLVWDTGAYADSGPVCTKNAGHGAAGPYVIPNVMIDSYCVYTNKPIGAPMRSFGVPQIAWAGECQMNILAEKLRMDPLELRLRNVAEEGSLSATGETLVSVGVKEALQRVAEDIAWGKKTPGRGKGIACVHKTGSFPGNSAAFVKVNEDGGVHVMTSAMEMGQGYNTAIAQVTAEVLGIPLARVQVAMVDTDYTPFDSATVGSRALFQAGEAVRKAAIDARHQIFQAAAKMLEANPEDLEAKEAKIYVKGSPEKGVALARVCQAYHSAKGGPILGRGAYTPSFMTGLDPETGQGAKPTPFWMYGAHAVEVEVDKETGNIKVLKACTCHDAGRVVNPSIMEGQLEGGAIMGLSTALWEELKLEKGKAVNTNLADYKISTSLDAPELTCSYVENPHPEGPFGAKGAGELTNAASAPALANAIYDAVGVRPTEIPITPERLLTLLRSQGK